MGNAVEKCKDTNKQKELILTALKMSGYTDMETLAKCIEEGKVSINGCTTFNAETDKALQHIMDKYNADIPVRKIATAFSTLLRNESNAVRSYHNLQARFTNCVHDVVQNWR